MDREQKAIINELEKSINCSLQANNNFIRRLKEEISRLEGICIKHKVPYKQPAKKKTPRKN